MFRAIDWIGKAIVAADSGKEVGDVVDLTFDGDRLSGLVVPAKVPWGSKGCIPVSSIETNGPDVIMVKHVDRVVGYHDDALTLKQGTQHILGKRAMTVDGFGLGVVSDVYIDQQMENIVGYEISQGIMRDFVESMFMPVSQREKFGEDWLIFKSTRPYEIVL